MRISDGSSDVCSSDLEIAGFVQVAQIVGLGCEVLEQRAVMHGYCQMAVVQLLDEAGAAAGDVDVFADQIAVDAIREVDEVEIEIVDAAAELGGEVIAQVFRIQMIEIAARL